MCGFELLFGLLDAGLRAADIGAGRTQIAAGVDGGDGHGDIGRGGVGLGAGKGCLRVLDGDLVVAGIELGDDVAGLDELVLLDVDLEHLAGDARTYLDEVAVDLGIVSVFAEGGAPPETGGDEREHDEDNDEDAPAPGLRLCNLSFRDRFARGRCWTGIRHDYFPPK